MAVSRCITPVCLLFLLSFPVRASVRPARSVILDEKTAGLVDALTNVESPFPPALIHRGDVYVLFEIGGAHCRVTVLAPERENPEHVAVGLVSAVTGAGIRGGAAKWSSEHHYSVASVSVSRAHIGIRQSSVDLPVGAILAGLRRDGRKPYALLRVMKSANASALPKPWRIVRYSRLYDANVLPADTIVRTRADLPGWAFALTFALFAIFPVLNVLLALTAIGVALRRKIPLDRRRKLFAAMCSKAILPLLCTVGMAQIAYLHSDLARRIADLWFGQFSADDSAGNMGYGIMGGVFIVIVFSLAGVEAHIFRSDKARKRPKPVAPRAEAISARWTYAGCGAQILGVISIVAVTNGIFGWKPDGPLWIAAPLVLMLGVSLVCLLIAHDVGRNTAVVSEELTARAGELARRMGAVARDVRIDESTTGQLNPNACMLPNGRIRITRLLVDSLESAEIDWVLAHELAHSRRHHWRRAWWLVVLLPMSYFPMLTTTVGRRIWEDAPWVPIAIFAAPAAAIVFSQFALTPRAKTAEFDADRDALAVTRDLAAAESALLKMAENSAAPAWHDVDDQSSHPALSKRLDALRKAAREMGIAEPSTESATLNWHPGADS